MIVEILKTDKAHNLKIGDYIKVKMSFISIFFVKFIPQAKDLWVFFNTHIK